VFVRPDRIVAAVLAPRDVRRLIAVLAPFQPSLTGAELRVAPDRLG
jgi:hypothetical protein